VPGQLVRPVAGAIPAAELAIVALLVFPVTAVPWDAAATLLVLIVFIAAVSTAAANGGRLDVTASATCTPSGPDRARLLRDLVLAAAAGLVAVAGSSDPGPGAVVGWFRVSRERSFRD
jgi:hypothetical protein